MSDYPKNRYEADEDISSEDFYYWLLNLPPEWNDIFKWFLENSEYAIKKSRSFQHSSEEIEILLEKAVEIDNKMLHFLLELENELNFGSLGNT